ncbi:ATP-dependent nuclease [Amycolatopsis sp. CA-161197]|uniref:ATP-dependent nuclease n=1 Tax=Amycolatopsis sp. CA-161197 TaxID=3239922 RepID=UPI003D8FB2D3
MRDGDNTLQLEFAPGITVVSGGNGAGKSSTLGAIWKCLKGESGTSRRLPYWLAGVEITGLHDGAAWTASFDAKESTYLGQCPVSVEYIDPSAETERILTLFREDDHPDDLTEGVDPTELDAEHVELLSYVLRRHYEKIRVFEVTAFSDDDEPVPFFEVVSMGSTYGLTTMGRGELSATYLLWRLNNIEHGSIVLIEEPESHLAMYSQRALVESMIATVVSRDLTVVVSSHSPSFIRSLPSKNVVLLNSSPIPSIRAGLDASEVALHLGLQPACDAVLMTEDVVAEGVLRETLKAQAPDLLNRVATRYVSTGESGLRRVIDELKIARDAHQDFLVLGVLDGDQRTENPDKDVTFLIGNAAPDQVLRQATIRWRNGENADWAPSFVEDRTRFEMALEALDGYDHHDWITELAKKFGGYGRILGDLVQLCLRDEGLTSNAEQLIDWLRDRLK